MKPTSQSTYRRPVSGTQGSAEAPIRSGPVSQQALTTHSEKYCGHREINFLIFRKTPQLGEKNTWTSN